MQVLVLSSSLQFASEFRSDELVRLGDGLLAARGSSTTRVVGILRQVLGTNPPSVGHPLQSAHARSSRTQPPDARNTSSQAAEGSASSRRKRSQFAVWADGAIQGHTAGIYDQLKVVALAVEPENAVFYTAGELRRAGRSVSIGVCVLADINRLLRRVGSASCAGRRKQYEHGKMKEASWCYPSFVLHANSAADWNAPRITQRQVYSIVRGTDIAPKGSTVR